MKRVLALLLLLASPALADTVTTTDGRKLEGTVTERDGKIVVSPKKGIEIILDKGDIEKIEIGSSLKDEYAKKKADLVPGDPEPRYALAVWCKEKGLSAESKEMLEEVLRLAPDHAQARRDLGYVKDGDQWVTEDALRKKLGFEKVNGKWIPAADAKRLRRSEEIKRLLVRFALVWPNQDKKAQAARAELDALATTEDPNVLGPLVEERLGEHDASVRFAFVQLLGKAKAKTEAKKLVALAFEDEDRDVRLAAGKSAWQLEDNGARTTIVQSLFSSRPLVRERAAEVLAYVQDRETVPYLIEALYLVTTATVQVEEQPISRGFGGVRSEGVFGGYWVSAGEVHLETRYVYLYSKKALTALQKITGKDFDYSKHDWFEWWEREGKKKPDAGAAPPK